MGTSLYCSGEGGCWTTGVRKYIIITDGDWAFLLLSDAWGVNIYDNLKNDWQTDFTESND